MRRYNFDSDGCRCEDPDGEWVPWEDVEPLVRFERWIASNPTRAPSDSYRCLCGWRFDMYDDPSDTAREIRAHLQDEWCSVGKAVMRMARGE